MLTPAPSRVIVQTEQKRCPMSPSGLWILVALGGIALASVFVHAKALAQAAKIRAKKLGYRHHHHSYA